MRNLIRLFWHAPGSKPFTVLGALVLASLTEGIGIATLLPLLAVVAGPEGDASASAQRLMNAFRAVGIEPTLVAMLVVALGAMLAKSAITLVAMRHIGNTAANVMTELRRSVMRRLLHARWPYLTGQPQGRFTHAISGEAARAADAYVSVAQFLALGLQTVVFIGVAFFVSWQLALTALLMGALVGVSLRALIGMAKRAGRKQTEAQAGLLVFLNDTLSNLKPIRVMGRGESFADLLDRRAMKVRKALRQQVLAKEGLSSLQDALIAVSFAVIVLLVHFVWPVGLATLMVSGVVLARTASNTGKLLKSYQQAVTVESAYDAINGLLTDLDAAAEPLGGGGVPALDRGIAFENVVLTHGRGPALRGIDLALPANRLSVLIGPSGAGKTSVIDLLLGLYEPSSGRILIDGVPLERLDRRRWRGLVGYVPQELHLLHDTVRHNVSLGDPEVNEPAVLDALRMAGALGFVLTMPEGIDTIVGEGGGQLSGGQRQRIALARALAKKPRLLILDEVTSALDPETGRTIAAAITDLRGAMTIIAITHREEFIDVADRVVRLEAGRVAQVEGVGV